MRDSSWALGENAAVRKEKINVGPHMATRDREAKNDIARDVRTHAFKGYTTTHWGPRNLDNLDTDRLVFDKDKRGIKKDHHKRHGE